MKRRAQPQNHRVAPGTKGAAQLMARHAAANATIMGPLHALVARAGETDAQRQHRLDIAAHNAEVEYRRQLKKAKARVGPEIAAQLEGMVDRAVGQVMRSAEENVRGLACQSSKPSGSSGSSSSS